MHSYAIIDRGTGAQVSAEVATNNRRALFQHWARTGQPRNSQRFRARWTGLPPVSAGQIVPVRVTKLNGRSRYGDVLIVGDDTGPVAFVVPKKHGAGVVVGGVAPFDARAFIGGRAVGAVLGRKYVTIQLHRPAPRPVLYQGDCEVCSGRCSFESRVGDYLVCPSCKENGPQEPCANGCAKPAWLEGGSAAASVRTSTMGARPEEAVEKSAAERRVHPEGVQSK